MRRIVPALILPMVAGALLLYRAELQRFIALSPGTAEKPPTSTSRTGTGRSDTIAAVLTTVAKSGSLPIIRQTIGSVVPLQTTSLGSPLAGIVSQIVAKGGADVVAGDLLVQLDDRTTKANVQKDQALLAKDQATLDDANMTLKRIEGLNASGIDTQQQYGDAVSAAKQAAATIEVDKSVLAADNILLSQTQIRAPFDGRLGAVTVSPGAYLSAGAPVVTLTQMKPVYAEFTLPEPDLGLIRLAMDAGTLTVAAMPPLGQTGDPPQTGPVVFIDNAIDAASGTFKLRAQLSNEALTLWPGQSLDVTVTAGARDGVVIVPAVALQPQGDGYICFVVKADQTIEIRKVSVGLIVGDSAGVTSGVKDGEVVVTEGQAGLVEGAHVTATAKGTAQ
ncbi:efflux RND transporter periplasmic adaptor subunit [Shinella sp. AETb1-6]|uniref:efflux RND transporter periplasmic adaptor subunit n=1 Tax=Shinella sp. AETb1-6 TaxID=2692210 RepID=UPI00136E0973|nr:efflux RND transporter periplasmic adaptor subunit [Shinella sp. AETb1-6]MXN52777.1 efflux RND transporter periplasmic adaptor subunit [Shinella sp. AETb1-6]